MKNPYIENIELEIHELAGTIAVASRHANKTTLESLHSRLRELLEQRDIEQGALEALEMLQS